MYENVCVAVAVFCLRYELMCVHLNRAVSVAGSLPTSHFVVYSAEANPHVFEQQRFVCVTACVLYLQ